MTNVALLGCGTVGLAVYELLNTNAKLFDYEAHFNFTGIGVADIHKSRAVPQNLLTTDLEALVKNPKTEMVVELMGDSARALDLIKLALAFKKPVVTANKALLAKHGPEIFALAKKHQTRLWYEASVAGAIPIMQVLQEGLNANQILRLYGIVNGTSNYILSQMSQHKVDFATALAQAQKLGFAEADPAADVDGVDATHKLCLLFLLCYGQFLNPQNVFTKGIRYILPLDIQMAKEFGYVIKLLATIKSEDHKFSARLHPTMIKDTSPLAHVHGAFNAIQYDGDFCGRGMMLGAGAGGRPTASAVVSDMIAACRWLKSRVPTFPDRILQGKLPSTIIPQDMLELQTRYYIRFSVLDKPHVLAKITAILAKHLISIQHLYQHGQIENDCIPLIVFTHLAKEADIRLALKEIDALDNITQTTKIIRIEDEA